MAADVVPTGIDFNPRAPCGARRYILNGLALVWPKFQSTRPMRGATPDQIETLSAHMGFQSTRPMRGATSSARPRVRYRFQFQSTRPMRGATPPTAVISMVFAIISIHAPHAGRDPSASVSRAGRWNFNPRAPCGARLGKTSCFAISFRNFNPRAPCGARPQLRQAIV